MGRGGAGIRTIAAAACAAALLSGCSGSGADAGAGAKELEAYGGAEPEGSGGALRLSGSSGYGYLCEYSLNAGGMTLAVYLPGTEGEWDGDRGCSASLHGVTVEYSVISGAGSPEDALPGLCSSRADALEADPAVSGVSVSAPCAGDGWAFQEIDYSVGAEGALFPCRAYVKADGIAGEALLETCVTVDDSLADLETGEVAREALDAAGISVPE